MKRSTNKRYWTPNLGHNNFKSCQISCLRGLLKEKKCHLCPLFVLFKMLLTLLTNSALCAIPVSSEQLLVLCGGQQYNPVDPSAFSEPNRIHGALMRVILLCNQQAVVHILNLCGFCSNNQWLSFFWSFILDVRSSSKNQAGTSCGHPVIVAKPWHMRCEEIILD